jgi:hypothetical protein
MPYKVWLVPSRKQEEISTCHPITKAFTGGIHMNRNQARRLAAFNAKKAAEKLEMKAYCKKIDRAFSRLSEGCSERVSRAISLAGTRQKEVEGGAVCLPEVALFAAGHRKVRKDAVHIVK